ncbi:PepSY domain-containing protein [Alteromonas facilis]|uniref:PepSY domain-containing protein n=1 Tax=Alteromonas facilis TaxID=2048004 RepID=UPI000C285015|nr:PepSY domain-containing protein [Alteromonas facilis]
MRIWRTWHQWIGLIIGIQVLLWIAGGLYMSAVPLPWVHGKPLLNEVSQPLSVPSHQAKSLEQSISIADYASMAWVHGVDQTLLKVTDFSGKAQFLVFSQGSWHSAEVLAPTVVEQEAQARYAGDGAIEQIQLLQSIPAEAAGVNAPAYRVDFNDWIHTSFYIHPVTGEVLKVRSDLWRLFDIFWMLHIMDYETRDDFNNPLLIASAVTALFFTVTGMVLVVSWARKRLLRPRRR